MILICLPWCTNECIYEFRYLSDSLGYFGVFVLAAGFDFLEFRLGLSIVGGVYARLKLKPEKIITIKIKKKLT